MFKGRMWHWLACFTPPQKNFFPENFFKPVVNFLPRGMYSNVEEKESLMRPLKNVEKNQQIYSQKYETDFRYCELSL